MFQHSNITAGALDRKTVAFTFDDGPGPETKRLSRVLCDEGIRAVFFVTGQHAAKYVGVVDALVGDGHLVGNHTFDHPVLPKIDGSEAVRQILDTHQLIVRASQQGPYFFRAPWGKWPGQTLADLLNRERELRQYIGPINWDANGCDYDFWTIGRAAEECAENYRNVIQSRPNGGIVLMHDNRFDDSFVTRNYKPVELVMELIPQLRADGYEFVRLDELASIQRLIRAAHP